MSKLFEAMREIDNETETTNGCPALKSTLDACLDLFFKCNNFRNDLEGSTKYILDAYREDPLTCLRILFYARDIRGGQGERSIFRHALRTIAKFDDTNIIKNLHLIPEYGRWDDLIYLYGASKKVDSEIKDILVERLNADLWFAGFPKDYAKVSLLAKWLPSENTSSKATVDLARKIRKDVFGFSPKKYRKTLTHLRNIINVLEAKLSKRDYTFDYSKLPSRAMQKYKAAFMRNDANRYTEYINKLAEAVKEGHTDVKINVGTLYPYEIIKPVINGLDSSGHSHITDAELSIIDSAWRSQPNRFTDEAANENWLVMADVSGSMFCANNVPIAASISLAMYIAEHNHGLFANKFMTFASHPSIIEYDPRLPLNEKIEYIANSPWGYNTNLEAAFKIILDAAVKNHIPQSEMPTTLLIVSDMQFDCAVYGNKDDTMYHNMRHAYTQAGYEIPKVVFWNVAASNTDNVPVAKNENGVILIGGYAAGQFDQIMNGTTPIDFMKSVVNSERYSAITLHD